MPMEDAKKTVLDVTTSTSTGSDPENPEQDPVTITPPPKPGERGLNLDKPEGGKS
jgi:hypothetical protein